MATLRGYVAIGDVSNSQKASKSKSDSSCRPQICIRPYPAHRRRYENV